METVDKKWAISYNNTSKYILVADKGTLQMQQIDYNGKRYYYNGTYFVDEFFLILEGEELRNVANEYFQGIDYPALDSDQLLEVIMQMKTCGMMYEVKKVIGDAFVGRAHNKRLLHSLLPIYTSCCRELNQPKEAIAIAEVLLPVCGGSTATYTSLAAAYCDIGDYEKAKKYAGIAYAKQGGGQGYKNELSLVYKRIAKETGNTPNYDDYEEKPLNLHPPKSMPIVHSEWTEEVATTTDNKPTSMDILKCVADSVNPYTGELIAGIDDELKEKLLELAKLIGEK